MFGCHEQGSCALWRISGSNQGDLRNVIFQPRQFTCVMEEAMVSTTQNIFNMRPDELHYEIADWALQARPAWWTIVFVLQTLPNSRHLPYNRYE